MKTMHAGLLVGHGWVTQVLAVLLLLSAAVPVLGRNRKPLDLTQPCVVIRRNRKFMRSVNDAAAAGYRVAAVGGGSVIMAHRTAPPDTYRYVRLSLWDHNLLSHINWLGAVGYRVILFRNWPFLMEKAPHPRNWHYGLLNIKEVGGVGYLEFPGSDYHFYCAFSQASTPEHSAVLFEEPGELRASEKPFLGGKVLTARQRDLSDNFNRGYRVLEMLPPEGFALWYLLEKPSKQEESYKQRLIPKSKDTATTEVELNAAGKEGFRLLRASMYPGTIVRAQKFLVTQQSAMGARVHFSYRIREANTFQRFGEATAAACTDRYEPVAVDFHGHYTSRDVHWIYFEKKSGTEITPQQAHPESAEETGGKSSLGPSQSGPTVLAKDTPVEIELLTDISSESRTPRTPVQFKVVWPVKVNGKTVIASGTPAQAVALTQAAAHGGKPGTVVLSRLRTTGSDGTRIPLRFARWVPPTEKAKSHAAKVIFGGVSAGAMTFLDPAYAALWAYPLIVSGVRERKGKSVIIPAGERFEVYVMKAVSYTR